MSKYKSRNGTPEVHSARSKLDGLLQTLATKKEDSPSDEKDTEELEEAVISTPTKKSYNQKPSRKRKQRKDESPSVQDIAQYHHTYVMKLFDRSVDLAQFEEDSPLYPICRAWMRNQPHNKNLAPQNRSPTPERQIPPAYEDDEEVYQLPSPILIKSETGEIIDRRIPDPEPQPTEHLDIHRDLDQAPAPEELLLNNMARWKRIRQRWKEAGYRREAQYAASLEIIKNMYDRQCKE
ncbi:hypothetical protein LSH36_3g13046 [Paralvinella palmiformis]|uniref:Protein lin-37 homolog n=1 Tax=Paralvinella palmiformis TaxID=53620 RepID=A0AAD9NHC8_9ANNE|nr:hypothetical protein LSH36_3g13046 [Paralvinella palmiformis]